MPHKRAKKSTRDQIRDDKGYDFTPSQIDNSIPKSMTRILNAEKVQRKWREKKRKLEVDNNENKVSKKLKILPGEHIYHFNQRVEDDLRETVREATIRSRQKTKKSTKGTVSSSEKIHLPSKSETVKIEKDFAKLPSTRNLNDVVQAPPNLTRLPKLPKNAAGKERKAELPVSLAQKQLMEAERDKVIQRYRTMRESQRKDP